MKNESHLIYKAIYIKISVMIYYENLKFQIFDVAFLILLSVYGRQLSENLFVGQEG